MTFLGNDIVYLHDPLWKESRLEKWCKKVCIPEEIEFIFRSENPGIAARRIWSSKESSWKVLIKEGVSPFQNPKRIVLSMLESPDSPDYSFQYHHKGKRGWGRSFLEKDFTYALAANQPLEGLSYYSRTFPLRKKSDQSQAIRQLFLKDLFQATGWKNVFIEKNNQGVPEIKGLPQYASIDLSFSHDYPFGAYAYCIQKAKGD
jgi:hypothetical protein